MGFSGRRDASHRSGIFLDANACSGGGGVLCSGGVHSKRAYRVSVQNALRLVGGMRPLTVTLVRSLAQGIVLARYTFLSCGCM